MRRSLIVVGGLLGVLLAATTRADEVATVDPVLPTASERLATAIELSSCPGWRVVEWRPSRYLGELTGPTTKGADALNQLCRKALESYPAFLRKHALKFEKRDITLSLSLMPANTTLDGKNPRNLNDVTGRFKNSVPGCCNWGVYFSGNHTLFMRNDPVKMDKDQIVTHRMFARTFLHEMSHVLFDQWKVLELQPYLTRDQDEGMAEEWVRSLGYPYYAESSGEDRVVKAPMLSVATNSPKATK